MQDIIINGISITELKRQRDAIRQGAAEFIAERIEEAKIIINVITEAESVDLAEEKAEEAFALLDSAQLVSGVSGVEYCLPYNEPNGWGDSETLSGDIESWAEDNDVNHYSGRNPIAKLYDLLGTMENNSFLWNSSSIGC